MKWDAAYLKRRYDVWGSFYDVKLAGCVRPCRNSLEIMRKSEDLLLDIAGPERSPYEGRPDAVLIAMNPGSSYPLRPGFKPNVYRLDGEFRRKVLENRPVEAYPDTMQFQVMRLMERFGWNHVRVINLSDYREAKSGEFLKLIAGASDSHSIFCESRREELAAALATRPGGFLIAAWGLDKELKPLADLAKEALGARLVGLEVPAGSGLYRYPSPMLQSMKDIWLQDMVALIEDKGHQPW